MESNDLITFAAIKEQKERILDEEEKLEPQTECCIYRVPKNLRKMNEEAYTPQVISIGPLHFGNKELFAMEKQKIRFVGKFYERVGEEKLQEFICFIKENEQHIRNCYAEMPKFKKLEFITMILYDAVFIIEYLLRSYHADENDFLMNNLRREQVTIWTDLLLLENQLPYFVLKGLYMLAFSEPNQNREEYPRFFSLSVGFLFFVRNIGEINEKEVKHFTDLKRYFITKMTHAKPKSRSAYKDLPCVVKLHESGVKFKRLEGSEHTLDVTVQKKKLLKIPFLNFPELQMPHIQINDQTEILNRNLMALEKCHYPDETHVCNYINLMDRLINTVEDVNFLVEAGIISNCVGDTAKIATMFNQLCSFISCSDSCYSYVVEDLNAFYNNPWNRTKANLKRVYFSNLWRGTGTIAAILLLLLTLIQTICSIKSVL